MRPTPVPFLLALLLAGPGAAAAAPAEEAIPAARSLAGKPLYRTPRSEAARTRLEGNLAEARAAFDAEPDEDATIWLGRRLAYLQRYDEAIAVYSEGLERFPESYRLHRHRGHRYISTRRLERAVEDLERAYALMPKDVTELEPDGIPNAIGRPLSNTQFNVLYHLALAHYLRGAFAEAEAVWRECLDYSPNPDLLVATTDWLYMTLRRQGKDAEAAAVLEPITPELEVVENDAYLKRLRVYRGELSVDALFETDADDRALALATQGYGVANWYLYNGDAERAAALRQEIFDTGAWAAFGYIAAEADEVRLAGE